MIEAFEIVENFDYVCWNCIQLLYNMQIQSKMQMFILFQIIT